MYIGIDLGGTNLKAGVINERNEIVYQHTVPTNASDGKDAVLDTLIKFMNLLTKKFIKARSIGIGVPGVTTDEGVVVMAPNLPGWENVPLIDILKEHTNLPITLDNDANLAAYAELFMGAARDTDSFLYVSLGTGVGGAIVIDRQIYRGLSGGAGELGHMIIDIGQKINPTAPYRTGILEEFIGRKQISDFAKSVLKNFPNSILHRSDKTDPYFISQALYKNDEAAKYIFTVIGEYLGVGLASVLNVLDLRLVVIGGGLSQAHPLFLDVALETVRQRALPNIANEVEIRRAEFLKDAGIVGAAVYAKNLLNMNGVGFSD
jgi:glucokinase